MQISLDLQTYQSNFISGIHQYQFFILFSFPTIDNKITPGESSNIFSELLSVFGTPYGANAERNKYPYLVRSTSLPDSIVEEKIVNLQMIDYKYPGIRQYNDWTVQLNVDTKGEILFKLWQWQEKMRSGVKLKNNAFIDYAQTQQLFLIDGQGNVILTYKLVGAWPKNISQVTLDYSSNELTTVDVTFSYQYFDVLSTTSSEVTKAVKSVFSSLVDKIF